MYSVDSRGSFEEAARLREQIIETKCHIGGGGGGGSASKKGAVTSTHVPIVIAGNKCDRDMRQVYAKRFNYLCNHRQSAHCQWNIQLHLQETCNYWSIDRKTEREIESRWNQFRLKYWNTVIDDCFIRTVSLEETSSICADFAGCRLIETSAKKNLNVDELFRQLFQLADLPPEMAPNSHRRLLPGQVNSTTRNSM